MHEPDRDAVPVDSTDAHLYLELDDADATILDGEDEATCAPFDWQAGYDEIRVAEVPIVPAVVVTSRVGRWLEVREPEAYRPFSLVDVEDRWQRIQRVLATQLRAPQVISRVGAHYVHTDAPALVATAIDAVVQAARSGEPVAVPVSLSAEGTWVDLAEQVAGEDRDQNFLVVRASRPVTFAYLALVHQSRCPLRSASRSAGLSVSS